MITNGNADKCKAVACYDLNTKELIKVFQSQTDAARWLIRLDIVK